jgi:iron complex transport system substrate-binding protein
VRIVSLLPSATDMVCSLGLRDELVGRTHECDWPPGVEDVPVMTKDALESASMSSREIDQAVASSVHRGSSIYALDHEALAAAKPDLILTQELCDVCAVSYREVTAAARMLEAQSMVVSLEPRTLEEILSNVETVGELTDSTHRAKEIVEGSRERVEQVRHAVAGAETVPTVCIEWLDPIFDAGHWVPEQVAAAGGRELLGRAGEESRRREWHDVVAAEPEALILLPCGLDLQRARREASILESRPGWSDIPAVDAGRVWLVDGPAFFNRPGPRAIRGVEVLASVLHGVGSVGEGEAVRFE